MTEDDFKGFALRTRLSSQLPNEAILPHMNFVLEACLFPLLNEDLTIKLHLKDCITGKDIDFLSALLGCIKIDTSHSNSAAKAFDNFRLDVYKSMAILAESQDQFSTKFNSKPLSGERSPAEGNRQPVDGSELSETAHSPFLKVSDQTAYNFHHDLYSRAPVLMRFDASHDMDTGKSRSSIETYNKHQLQSAAPVNLPRDYGARPDNKNSRIQYSLTRSAYMDLNSFSSQIRKHGMDIIIHSSVHDKALCCIYLASTISIPGEDSIQNQYPARTHKDLVDAVMHVQDVGHLGYEEKVPLSKTKLRGVLGLLKNAGVLIVQHEDEQNHCSKTTHFDSTQSITTTSASPIKEVKLVMNPSVRNFEDFRKMHDNYIPECLKLVNAKLSATDTSRVIWSQADKESKLTRSSCYIGLIRGIVKAQLIRTYVSIDSSSLNPFFIKNRLTYHDEWTDISQRIERVPQMSSPGIDSGKLVSSSFTRYDQSQTGVMGVLSAKESDFTNRSTLALPSMHVDQNYNIEAGEESKISPEHNIFGSATTTLLSKVWDQFSFNEDIERLTKDLLKK